MAPRTPTWVMFSITRLLSCWPHVEASPSSLATWISGDIGRLDGADPSEARKNGVYRGKTEDVLAVEDPEPP